jgi:hypothetical protein
VADTQSRVPLEAGGQESAQAFMTVVTRSRWRGFGAAEGGYLDVAVGKCAERINVVLVIGGKPAIQQLGVPGQVIR